MNERLVGVLGAMSLVGGELLPLLVKKSWRVTAYSRQRVKVTDTGVEWRQIDEEAAANKWLPRSFNSSSTVSDAHIHQRFKRPLGYALSLSGYCQIILICLLRRVHGG